MKIIDWKTLKTMLPVSRQTIVRWETERPVDPFPRRIKLGTGKRARIGWNLDAVQDWIEDQSSKR